MNQSDTIVGLATPPGRGAIAVFRISGRDIHSLLGDLLPLADIEPRRIYRYLLKNKENELVDEIMYVVYKAPNSYTGEDMVEIFSHGGWAIGDQIFRLLLSVGIRAAEPGEFTFRAVLNNKMDIIKAEAIDAICRAENIDQLRTARDGLIQKSGRMFDDIYRRFLDLFSEVVVAVEFEEETGWRAISAFEQKIKEIRSEIAEIVGRYERLRYSVEGVDIIIAGRTNVGKSSLFNRLIREERAIVTEFHGTTRDSIDRKTFLNNIPVRIVDTAGLRETSDTVELVGQRRSREEIEKADIILYVIDVESGIMDIDRKILDEKRGRVILVVNKIDLMPDFTISGTDNVFYISAKFDKGIDDLRDGIQEFLSRNIESKVDSPVFNRRQYHIFLNILGCLDRTIVYINDGAVLDIIFSELYNVRREFERLLGKGIDEDLYNNIFSRFCIGK